MNEFSLVSMGLVASVVLGLIEGGIGLAEYVLRRQAWTASCVGEADACGEKHPLAGQPARVLANRRAELRKAACGFISAGAGQQEGELVSSKVGDDIR